MLTHSEKSRNERDRSSAATIGSRKNAAGSGVQITDNRPAAINQRKLQAGADDCPRFLASRGSEIVQRKMKGSIVQLYDVVRGGTCKASQFAGGSGVTKEDDDTLSGVSTQSMDGIDRDTLCGFFRNGQVGIAEDTDITDADGELVHDGTKKNPYHATVNGLTAQKCEELFTPTIKNPNRRK